MHWKTIKNVIGSKDVKSISKMNDKVMEVYWSCIFKRWSVNTRHLHLERILTYLVSFNLFLKLSCLSGLKKSKMHLHKTCSNRVEMIWMDWFWGRESVFMQSIKSWYTCLYCMIFFLFKSCIFKQKIYIKNSVNICQISLRNVAY